MAELPSEEEVWDSVGKLKNGKAGGATGILPEMVKAASCEEVFMSALMELVHDVWRKCRVPGNWRDAILVPIPKKGDFSSCDNWRGISLLDVVGKVVAKVVVCPQGGTLNGPEEAWCTRGDHLSDSVFSSRYEGCHSTGRHVY